MNPEIRRLLVALNVANGNVNSLVAQLADAEARIEQLEAQLKAALEPKKAE